VPEPVTLKPKEVLTPPFAAISFCQEGNELLVLLAVTVTPDCDRLPILKGALAVPPLGKSTCKE